MTTPAWLDELERLEKSVAFGDGLALRRAVPALIAAARREAKMREACQIASNCLKRIPDPDDAEKVTLDIINAALEDQTP